jgi:hypothetical protein
MVQVVELLPSKHEALSSNPSTEGKKKNLREYTRGGEFAQSILYASMELSQ